MEMSSERVFYIFIVDILYNTRIKIKNIQNKSYVLHIQKTFCLRFKFNS